jgi:GNAT superfamily N-acetyltransferase
MLRAMSLPGSPWRLARAQDVPALASLYADTARRCGPACYTPDQVNAWASFAADTAAFGEYVLGATTWVAEAPQGPLGFCGIDDRGEVRSLYVAAGHLRQGLGSRLLAHALAHARQHGIAAFAAWATPFSMPVFGRAGFALVRTVREPFQGVLFDRYRMVSPAPGADAPRHGGPVSPASR